MSREATSKRKEFKILKCIKCSKEYIFVNDIHKCPDCEGVLKAGTAYVKISAELEYKG
jgi:hypothetical protein